MTTAALVLPDSSSAAPAVHCLAGDASVAAAVVRGDDAMILVAEDAGTHSDELADLFRSLAGRGTPLGALAVLLDDAISSWGGARRHGHARRRARARIHRLAPRRSDADRRGSAGFTHPDRGRYPRASPRPP